MQIFETGDKVNFVDKNNVVLGYDLSQDCCENADYFFCDKIPETNDLLCNEIRKNDAHKPPENFEKYVFDKSYCNPVRFTNNSDYLDGGDAVFFKINKGKKFSYICIYNAHNGYYAHGFTVEISGKTILEGSL